MLNQAEQMIALRSAVGMIGARRTAHAQGRPVSATISEGAIARQLMAQPGRPAGMVFADAQAAARRALRSDAVATRMQRRPDAIIAPGDYPVDPTLRQGDERYRYVLRVTVTSASGVVTHTMIEYRSDVAESMTNLRLIVSAQIETYDSTGRATSSVIGQAGQGADVRVDVVQVGRRG